MRVSLVGFRMFNVHQRRQVKLRVAVFPLSLRGGGVERVIFHLVRRFAERGYDVDLVLAQREGPYLSEVHENANVVDLKAAGVLKSLPALIRYLRKAQPAALLFAMDHSNLIALWANLLARTNTRIVVSVHNTISKSVQKSNIRHRLIPYIARWCYGWANGVVAVSRGRVF